MKINFILRENLERRTKKNERKIRKSASTKEESQCEWMISFLYWKIIWLVKSLCDSKKRIGTDLTRVPDTDIFYSTFFFDIAFSDDEADYEEYSFALAPQARSAVGYYNIQNNNIESNDDKDDINNDDNNNKNDDNNNKNNNSHDHDNNSQIDNNNIDSHEKIITW